MKYDPNIHKRRSIRLKGYDYSQSGMYFITICCIDKACLLGNIVASNPDRLETSESKMILNDYGKIAYDEWMKLPNRFNNVELDVFQIMPNHFHGIIVLNDFNVGAPLAGALETPNSSSIENTVNKHRLDPPNTISTIVGIYKSLVSNECLKIYKSRNEYMGGFWQRNYYEHIIRNEKSYEKISAYIINNPLHWEQDKFFKKY